MSKRIISVALTAVMLFSALTAGCVTASAKEGDAADVLDLAVRQDAELVFIGADDYNPKSDEVEKQILDNADTLPDKVDLRNFNGMNYVTPVKFQNPFGSCWAFGIAAAAEESYLFDNGLGVPAGEVNDQVDFSEKYINWYMYHAMTDDDVSSDVVDASQVGEGYDVSVAESADPNAVYNFGGSTEFAPNFFASGFGPVDESTVVNGELPYVYRGRNGYRMNDTDESEESAALRKEHYKNEFYASLPVLISIGLIGSADEFDAWFESYWHEGSPAYDRSFATSNYAPFDDWSLPLNAEYRTPSVASYFKNSYTLPAPAKQDGNGDYVYNPVGTAAIRTELANGHAVGIGFLADQSEPGQPTGDGGYMNTSTWSQYYTGPVTLNHEVAIIGYDDNYPKENFTRTFNGEVVEGSTPPADGAFIVKNSWGALTEEDKATATVNKFGDTVYENPNAQAWGVDDTGYFYLSYYDHSILRAYSFEFYTNKETEFFDMNYAQYDLLQAIQYVQEPDVNESKTANVFTAKENEYLVQISAMTVAPATTVHYEIYKDCSEGDPTSGTLLEEGEVFHQLSGYQRIDLDGRHYLNKDEKYSVVITQTFKTDDKDMYAAAYPLCVNSRVGISVNGVINAGESWLYKDGKWTDLAELKESIIEAHYQEALESFGSEEAFLARIPAGRDAIMIDNYPIKAFLVSEKYYGLDYLLGDADLDNEVDITDATTIQRSDVRMIKLDAVGKLLADVDLDGETTILDATWIQRYTVGLNAPGYIGVSLRTLT